MFAALVADRNYENGNNSFVRLYLWPNTYSAITVDAMQEHNLIFDPSFLLEYLPKRIQQTPLICTKRIYINRFTHIHRSRRRMECCIQCTTITA